MKHILCCFDGSEHADVALASATEFATRLSADLSVLVVNVAFARSPRGPHALVWTEYEAQAILAEGREEATRNGLKPANAAVGAAREVSTGIIDHALVHGIDAIAIGTGDKRGLSRLFPGSVAMDVANRSPCTSSTHVRADRRAHRLGPHAFGARGYVTKLSIWAIQRKGEQP